MREFEDSSRQKIAEAAAWMARLRAEDRTEADVRAFQTWFAADVAHFDAFQHVSEIWEASGRRPAEWPEARKVAPPSLTRRNMAAGLGALLTVGVGAGYWQSAQARVYQTDIGEQKHVVLEDGTRVFLDADTCCAVNFTETSRSVNLRYGRANFRILSDGARPFSVEAADSYIRTLQSQFDVRNDRSTNRLSVVLIEGRALVERRDVADRAETSEIVAGQQLIAEPSAKHTVSKADFTQMLAWQRGQANFEDTRLASAVYEMNRYSTSKIVLGPGLAELRISGLFSFGDNNAFAGAAARLLPVKIRVDHGSDQIQLLASNNNPSD